MRRQFILSWLLVLGVALRAQTPYFQQEVHYRIRATLNDTNHTLQAHVRMEYVNHAPHALTEIWMHLWPNAYQSQKTAFARQQLRAGKTAFYFAHDSLLGGLSQLDFRVNGQPAMWKYHPQHPDIALLTLPEPLPPGGRVVIETPYLLKIPFCFSRLGHVGQSYQISQWYPKPAVYDAKGWHPMPYLDLGEFYSEFGHFEVELTLPKNYVVGATGVPQTPEERDFLEKKIAETEAYLAQLPPKEKPKKEKDVQITIVRLDRSGPFPPSSPELKTIRFRANGVHDFAWFADKRYLVQRQEALLPSGRVVECWAMFTPDEAHAWKHAASFVAQAVTFFSETIGEYPWPQATAVEGAVGAGGGMEYPMVTVVAGGSSETSLETVIAHEVGHNWFYGILATNERDYAWMDEGLNSYYEKRYLEAHGKRNISPEAAPARSSGQAVFSLDENFVTLLQRIGANIPPETSAEAFSFFQYFAQVYRKPTRCLQWLEQYIGRTRLDSAMRHYYAQWQFRHPYPEDLRTAWKEAGLEADWFFDAMQTRHTFDMALQRVRRLPEGGYALRVKNKGLLDAPFNVSALYKGQVVNTQWYGPVGRAATDITFPDVRADAFLIDAQNTTLDLYRSDNLRRTSGLFPGVRPLSVRLLALEGNATRAVIGALPWVAWNNYDKTMVGLAIHSPILSPQRWRYYLLPGYGIGSGQWVGLADVQYRFLPGGIVPHATIGINARSATYAHRLGNNGYQLRFTRLSPVLHLDLRSPHLAFSHRLTLRGIFLQKEEPVFAEPNLFVRKNRPAAQIYELRYDLRNWGKPNPYRASFALEGQQYSVQGSSASYLRASAEWDQEFYYKKNKRLYVRLFSGYFLHNTQRRRGAVATNSLTNDVARASFALNPQGFNDYRFDGIFLGRTETSGLLARQVSLTEGGFKNAFGPAYAQVFGNSNDFIAALNVSADLPFLPLLRPYFDVGYFNDATPLGANRSLSEQLVWSGGLSLGARLPMGRFEVFFPIVNSSALRQLCDSATTNYGQRITWCLKLDALGWHGLLHSIGGLF